MVERRREKLLNVRMLDTEMEMLGELAQRERVSMSEWIRNCIRREHAMLGARAKRSKTKR
jgi:predicted HicB family RNase H-like nuclease